MKPFTKSEVRITIIIFLVTFIVTFVNMRMALRRSRDAQRRADLGSVSNALHAFHKDYGFFPPSENGRIKFCKAQNFDEVMSDISDDKVFDRNKLAGGLKACEWGNSSFDNLVEDGDPYLPSLPQDPRQSIGLNYFYVSDTEFFQLYAYLEGEESEDTYDAGIVMRGLSCGNKPCSYGKSYLDIPLSRSIEDYRREIEEKRQLN